MFQFVPRKVAQKTSRPPHLSPSSSSIAPVAPTSGPSSAPAPTPDHVSNSNSKRKSINAAAKDEDLAALLCLSLSDYTLWSNVDLRRAVALADEGWIPFSYLRQQSTYFVHLSSKPPEAALVRAVRHHAEDTLEIRMLVAAPSKAAWYGKEVTTEEQSGYEIRRKDWADALVRVRNSTRNEWETRTVYLESVPLLYRSVAGIYQFSTVLLSSTGSSRVQSITLPPHHLDRPGDVPKCKGFALVTLGDLEDAKRLVSEWPWYPRRTFASTNPGESSTTLVEAVKFGFRALSKARWDELKEEYVAHRQRLLDEIAGARSTAHGYDYDTDAAMEAEEPGTVTEAPSQPQVGLSLDPSAPFPPGCLVFVRNVHAETNKTTLKSLFSAHAFGGTSSALDYVDYNKGMTSCHLRLSTPHHARTLVSTFDATPIVQLQGLDGAGSLPPPSSSVKPITAEIVDGEREELYWNKVPEKVRREAVRKAIAQMAAGDQAGAGEGEDAVGDEKDGGGEGGKGRRPRKRRRKA
ncbi:hypothetical protein C8Q74DRAFT_1452023 [Fomes fomentarius]|nr:hypothetical protein C8Q74DRAFT_1452023 [Fomes fomentarius]